jgi:hypothetical protein
MPSFGNPEKKTMRTIKSTAKELLHKLNVSWYKTMKNAA